MKQNASTADDLLIDEQLLDQSLCYAWRFPATFPMGRRRCWPCRAANFRPAQSDATAEGVGELHMEIA